MTDSPDLEWIEPEELEPPDDPVGDAIRAANTRYAHALATADAERLCELFEPDGAIIDGDGPDAVGHEGLRDMAAYARERFADVTFEIDVDWVKIDPLDGAVAFANGTWRMAFVPRPEGRAGTGSGEAVRSSGTYAQAWHRGTDGAWRLHRDLTLTRAES